MPARSGRSSRRQRGPTRMISSVREVVRGLRQTSAGGLRGPSHLEQPVAMAIGGIRAELVGVEQEVAPSGTHSNDTATTAAPREPRRRLAVFGAVNLAARGNADGAFGQGAGGPSSARGAHPPDNLADT